MARIKIRYLVEKPRHRGLSCYYWQPAASLRAQGWHSRRVPADWAQYAEPEALRAAAIAAAERCNAELDAARRGSPCEHKADSGSANRTLDDLIAAYRASPDFAGLAPSTRRGYDYWLERLADWGGDILVRTLTSREVQALKRRLAATPSAANAVIRVLRLLLEFGRREGWLSVNPASRPKLIGSGPSGIAWPPEAVALFVATADRLNRPSIGTAVMLNAWLGQREADILRLPRLVAERADLITLRQNKTGAVVSLPIHMVPALVERVRAELERLDARYAGAARQPRALLVAETTGLPYYPNQFRRDFALVRGAMAADVPSFVVDYLVPHRADGADGCILYTHELMFMHLRHTAVTRLAEAGCDDELISAVTGHAPASVKAILQRYLVRTRKLARIAFSRRMAAESEFLGGRGN